MNIKILLMGLALTVVSAHAFAAMPVNITTMGSNVKQQLAGEVTNCTYYAQAGGNIVKCFSSQDQKSFYNVYVSCTRPTPQDPDPRDLIGTIQREQMPCRVWLKQQ